MVLAVVTKSLLRHRARLSSRSFSSWRAHCCKATSKVKATMLTSTTNEHPQTPNEYFSWIGNSSPCFRVKGENILVLTEPTQYYEVLKLKTRKAKRRITYASLYLGTGQLEQELVECVREACQNATNEGNEDFEVNILLDSTRASRGKNNSRTMLLPLLQEFPNMVNVYLYHTPDLRGIVQKMLPERYNETIGLTHIKVYLFDDSFVVSGANLSDNYFTNRQDRSALFTNCGQLANFFNDLVNTVSSFSFNLSRDDTLSLSKDWNIHPYQDSDDGSRFKWCAKEKVQNMLNTHRKAQIERDENTCLSNSTDDLVDGKSSDCDTWVYPLIQMGPLGITHDEFVTLTLLRRALPNDEILLTSGYFNLTDHYMHVILEESLAKYRVLMASPEVNGFYGAGGMAGTVPLAYIYVARQFYYKILERSQSKRIQMFEYFREKWTFHVKGLWYYLPDQSLPSMTLIGSPNFGYRSVYRDLECQLAIVTENEKLQQQLREEHVRLYQSSVLVNSNLFARKDRHVPTWAKLVTTIIKNFF